MSQLFEDVRPPVPLSAFNFGIVATTPALVTDLIDVVVPDFDSKLRFTDCRWMPRLIKVMVDVAEGVDVGGDTEPSHVIEIGRIKLPTRGDECLLVLDNRGQPWVVCWWPS